MNKAAVEQAAKQLVESIKLSEAYTEYEAACTKIKQTPEKYEVLNKVRRAYFFAAAETDTEKLKRDLTALQTDYDEIISQKWVVDFMEKEQRYCRLIQMVQSNLDEVLDFDMSFLTEEL